MNKFFFLILIVVTGAVACNQAETKTPHQHSGSTDAAANAITSSDALTSIQWLDSTFDKGTITEGEKLEVVYRFKNTGDKPLIIKSAKGSCGCTVPEKPEEPIAAGKEGFIKATFDSNNRPGPNHKTVTIEANTDPAIYQLSFNVVVNKKS